MDQNKLNRILNKVAKSQLLAPFGPYGADPERPDFAPIPYGLDEDGECYARGTCCGKSICGDSNCYDVKKWLGSRDQHGLDDAACRKRQLEEHREIQISCESVHRGRKLPVEEEPCSCLNRVASVYTAQERCSDNTRNDTSDQSGKSKCERRLEGRKPFFDVSILPEMCSDSDKIRRKKTCEIKNYIFDPDCDCENESFEDCALRHKNRCMRDIGPQQDAETMLKGCDCQREYLEALEQYYLGLLRAYISDIPECSICRQLIDGYRQEYERYKEELNALNVRCTTIFDDNPEEDDSDDPSGPRPPTGPTQPTRYP